MSEMRVRPEIHHFNLPVSDFRSSAEWYGRVLGYEWERDFVQEGEVTGVALRHPTGGTRLALRRTSHPLVPRLDLAPIAYTVPTTDDLRALAASFSPDDVVDLVFGPATSGALITFSDPDGHQVNIYSLEGT